MPKYTFKCSLGHETQKYVDISVKAFPCDHAACSAVMERQLPKLSSKTTVTEVVDKHTGVTWIEDQTKEVNDRKRTYYWEVEVPRMVNSGTYALETMLENKWVYYDDKGNLVTRTCPPESE